MAIFISCLQFFQYDVSYASCVSLILFNAGSQNSKLINGKRKWLELEL